MRKLIRDVLEGFGYEVLEAVDGEDAIRVFTGDRDKIRLTLLDVIMPKKNGKEVYKEMKEMNPELRALFMSGYTANVVHKKGILEPGLDFIFKPLSPADLLRKVREVLDK